ncbi:MAG: IS630 family transposase [Anaerolineae bacterium]|nr:IS630 family transposase [Anaerolineae bacterium]
MSVTAASIHNWRKRWEQAHLEGLSHRPISGRPSKATEAYWQSLEETLEQNPRSLGYRFSLWTTERLSQHLTEKTGIRLSAECLRVLMRERGYGYRRPKADLKLLQNAEARAEAEVQLEALKKKAESGDFELFFVDESTVNLEFPIRAGWMSRGRQKRLDAPSGAQGFYQVVGAYHWRCDPICYRFIEHKKSVRFVEFLDHLMMTVYPNSKVVFVMDNAPYHRSKMVTAALSLFEHRLEVFWLPPYCPVLKMIERFWKHLKDLATANGFFKSSFALLKSIERVLEAQNTPKHPLRLVFTKSL